MVIMTGTYIQRQHPLALYFFLVAFANCAPTPNKRSERDPVKVVAVSSINWDDYTEQDKERFRSEIFDLCCALKEVRLRNAKRKNGQR